MALRCFLYFSSVFITDHTPFSHQLGRLTSSKNQDHASECKESMKTYTSYESGTYSSK